MTDKAAQHAAQEINAQRLLEHIEILASDEFEGRRPGTTGEVKATEYLIHECKKLNLGLGDWMGGYLQKMPVTGVRANAELFFAAGKQELRLTAKQDFVERSAHDRERSELKNSDVVFVGYGI